MHFLHSAFLLQFALRKRVPHMARYDGLIRRPQDRLSLRFVRLRRPVRAFDGSTMNASRRIP
jgi:hypothetical protein